MNRNLFVATRTLQNTAVLGLISPPRARQVFLRCDRIRCTGIGAQTINRVRPLMALDGRELCVCQIIELLGLAPSTVSKHMSILKQARLVEIRKNGRWAYYRLAEKDATPEAREALARIRKLLQEKRGHPGR